MLGDVNLVVILLAALAAATSPGPATLAIAGTSMAEGRNAGLVLASGITTGSLIWSVSAALGLGALMLAHGWVMEIVRYFGVGYLLWLALKSAKSALSSKNLTLRAIGGPPRLIYVRGLALHLTNPKAVLFFGALFSIGVPSNATFGQLAVVVIAVGLQSLVVFHGYAVIFSTPAMTRAYIRMRRGFEAAFAIGFGVAGMKILTARLN